MWLAEGKDPDEKFEGWTPLMKATEGDHVKVMRMLLEKKANIEGCNHKERTALSIAAAPSFDGSTRRVTPAAALRLLLESGANPNKKDAQGRTPKQRALFERYDEASAIFEEFGC
jgi:ankyrin repeat protein